MMTEFTLNPTPTFSIDVVIPRAGSEDGILTFSFKHKKTQPIGNAGKIAARSNRTAIGGG